MMAAFPARMGTPPSFFFVECVIGAMKGKRRMGTIIKMMYSIVSMVLKMIWKILKFLGKPMWESLKGLCKTTWTLYKERKEKKAASESKIGGSEGGSGFPGPDESVKITPKDVFTDYKDEDLQNLYDKVVDLDVEVDKNSELEKLYETYGSDYERMKQDIMDELKRRNLTSKH